MNRQSNAALYAYESQVPASLEKARSLSERYGVDDSICRYFDLHAKTDARHSQVWRHLDGGRFEQLSVADFLDFTHRAFFLESIDERLHRCVSDALILGQALEYFPDRWFPEYQTD